MNVPILPLRAFRILAGDELATELDKHLAREEFTDLVLFTDETGQHLALLPVGAGQRFEKLEDAVNVEIEGLRALCATKAGPLAAIATVDLSARESALERKEAALYEREAQLDQREQALALREAELTAKAGKTLN